MFERVISLVGEDNLAKIKDKTVLVVGLGGVGGYATEALVRSGISNFILIDYDKIDNSNLNRQIISDSSNIGKYKVDIMKERILSINKDCNVIVINTFLNDETIGMLDKHHIDYIVDTKQVLYEESENWKKVRISGENQSGRYSQIQKNLSKPD